MEVGLGPDPAFVAARSSPQARSRPPGLPSGVGSEIPKPRLLISFSGGETSAYMTWWLLNHARDQYAEIVVVFANTGQENEETLEFVRDCDRHFGFGTVWIEAVQHHGERKSPSFRVVDFATADRSGAVFEDEIAKYGIPNTKFRDCTKYLKRRPIEAYARSIGWEAGTYDLAIGIRADEIDRMSAEREKRRIVYPLVTLNITKPQINLWFSRQPFRLRLKGYQGNCKWCWKKTLRKHLTLIGERPEIYDFPRRMEAEYGRHGPEFHRDPATRRQPIDAEYRRTFFRDNRSVDDLFALYEQQKGKFRPFEDDSQRLPENSLFGTDLDTPGGCGESCEVWADDDGEDEQREAA